MGVALALKLECLALRFSILTCQAHQAAANAAISGCNGTKLPYCTLQAEHQIYPPPADLLSFILYAITNVAIRQILRVEPASKLPFLATTYAHGVNVQTLRNHRYAGHGANPLILSSPHFVSMVSQSHEQDRP